MTVDDLRATLTSLVRLLEAADGKAGTIKALTEFIESTAGFGELNLKAFVKLAEVGRTPPTPKAASPQKRTATADPEKLASEVKDLYERVADPQVTEEQVRELCGRLDPLNKDSLARLAEGIGLYGMKSKKKADIIAEITNRLLERKGAAIRRGLIDRPVATSQPAETHFSMPAVTNG